MTNKIRVLRLIEYTFDSVETMEVHLKQCTHNMHVFQDGKVEIKSVFLPLEVLVAAVPTAAGSVPEHGTASRGDDGYRCFCGAAFGSNSGLALHIAGDDQKRTHLRYAGNEFSAFVCDCGRFFKTEDELTTHIASMNARQRE